jgi:hypothetical protein
MLFFFACHTASVRVRDVTDLGPLQTTDAIKARDGGYSARFEGRSLWLYGDTILSLSGEDGSSWRDNSWSSTEDSDATDGVDGFTEPVDALGAPVEFFPETEEEATYNVAHREMDHDGDGVAECEEPCGGREVLWPMDLVTVDDTLFSFYVKIHGEPGAWNFFSRGSGVATWSAGEAGPLRPEPSVFVDEPTLLFSADEPNFGVAVAYDDGFLYAWGYKDDGGPKQLLLGRVKPGEVEQRSSWRFWDGTEWVSEWEDAKVVVQGASQMKISFDPDLGVWLAVYMDEPWNSLLLRTAPAPEGPWSEPLKITDTEPPSGDGWDYCGLDHPEFAQEGVHWMSYYRSTGDWTGEIRLLRVELEN